MTAPNTGRTEGVPARGLAALIVTVLIWGSSYVVTKSALDGIGPLALSAVRFAVAMVTLWPVAQRQGYRLRMSLQPRFLRFGLSGIAIYYTLQNLGLVYTSAVTTALIQALIPAVTALLAVWLLKERLTRLQMVAVAIAVVGAAIIAGAGLRSSASVHAPNPLLGNALILASVFAWGIYTVQSKTLSADHSPVVSTTASIGAGLLVLLPLGLGEVALTGLPRLSGASLAAVVYLGLVASSLPIFLWNYALSQVRASVASTFLNLVPVVGVACGLFYGEALTPLQIAGGALTLLGVWLSGRRARSSAPARDAVETAQ